MTSNIPNWLTIFRIAVIPLIVLIYFLDIKYGNVIKLGAFLDPVADKLLVVAMLILVVTNISILQNVLCAPLFILTVLIIIGREMTVSALREWMAELGMRSNVAVSWIGKYKTGFQMTAMGFLLFQHNALGLPVLLIGELLLYIAAVLTVWSLCIYLSAAYKSIEMD